MYTDVSGDALPTVLDAIDSDGFMPTTINGYGSGVSRRYQVVAIESHESEWTSVVEVDAAALASAISANKSAGRRIYGLVAVGSLSSPIYSALFAAPGDATPLDLEPIVAAVVDMTTGEYQSNFVALANSGWVPTVFSASGVGTDTVFAAIWERRAVGVWGAHDRTESNFFATNVDITRNGGRLWTMSSYGGVNSPRFGGVWPFTQHPEYEVRRSTAAADQTPSDFATMAALGFRPEQVDARPTPGGNVEYTVTWRKDDEDFEFRVRGRELAALTPFDDAMESYMRARRATRGALAVLDGQRLVLARGYTFDTPGSPDVLPESLFRIASVSKPITAVGVLQLVERGLVDLDQSIGESIDLSEWVDPRAAQITVRDLLHHWGGFDRSVSGDPMFRDAQIASDLGKPLPISTGDIIDHTGRFRSLDFAPGSRFAYSNFGYAILGRVIEAASGLDYESYIQQNVLRSPDAIVTSSDSPDPREVAYLDPARRVGTTVLDGTASDVPYPYGVWNIANMDSHGGWAASVIDLARFAAGVADDARSPLLGPGSTASMWSRHPNDASSSAVYYGMGWDVRPLSGSSRNTWHFGSLDGTTSALVRRSDGLSWAVVFNQRAVGNEMPADFEIDAMLHQAANATPRPDYPAFDLFCIADLVEPFSITDLDDIDAFIPRFVAGDPSVDFEPPFGIVDLDDLDAFVTAYLAGCS